MVSAIFDEVLIGGLCLATPFGIYKAVRGKPPTRPVKLGAVILFGVLIQFGFHALATAMPSVVTVIAIVLAGWVSFTLWSVWLMRAPDPQRRDERGDEDRGGGTDDGGGGPDRPSRPPAGDHGVDWDAFERDFWADVERREPVAPR